MTTIEAAAQAAADQLPDWTPEQAARLSVHFREATEQAIAS